MIEFTGINSKVFIKRLLNLYKYFTVHTFKPENSLTSFCLLSLCQFDDIIGPFTTNKSV